MKTSGQSSAAGGQPEFSGTGDSPKAMRERREIDGLHAYTAEAAEQVSVGRAIIKRYRDTFEALAK